MVSVSLSIVWVLQGLIVGEVDESGEKSEGNAFKIHDVNPLALHHHGMDSHPYIDVCPAYFEVQEAVDEGSKT